MTQPGQKENKGNTQLYFSNNY